MLTLSEYIHGPAIQDLPNDPLQILSPLQWEIVNRLDLNDDAIPFFLFGTLRDLPSPFLLPDMKECVEVLQESIRSNHKILLFGDRDSDGVSSASLLGKFIREKWPGSNLVVKTSNEEDYGLCPDAMRYIRSEKPDLLITMDFGSTNQEEIQILRKEGIQVIVIDHHELPEVYPSCLFLNPKRPESKYPESKLCTSLLVWKYLSAILYSESEYYEKIYRVTDAQNSQFDGQLIQNGVLLDSLVSENGHAREERAEKVEIPNCKFPDRNLFFDQLTSSKERRQFLFQNLDLAAIGTITDMMPLTGESRIIVKEGLHSLQQLRSGRFNHRPGLQFLLRATEMHPEKITSKDLGWSIGPVLNAAGRMKRTDIALECMLADKAQIAESLTQKLLGLNAERRERTQRNHQKAKDYLDRKPERKQGKVIFCYEPDMEPGVSGIVATRLVEEFKRPAVFLAPDHGNAKGSIRSFGKENVLNLLRKMGDLFIQFGGHPEAAGFSVEIARIPELQAKIAEIEEDWLAEEESSSDHKNTKSLVQLAPEYINSKLYQQISALEPFGQEASAPILSIQSARVIRWKPLSGGKHAQFQLLGGGQFECLLWNRASELQTLLSTYDKLDFWGSLEENTFRSKTTLQLQILHFEPGSLVD